MWTVTQLCAGEALLRGLTGATVIPLVTRMESRGWQTRYVAPVGEPWADYPGTDDTADARRLNAFIEAEVLKSPEQYYWLHRRFKGRPEGYVDPYAG